MGLESERPAQNRDELAQNAPSSFVSLQGVRSFLSTCSTLTAVALTLLFNILSSSVSTYHDTAIWTVLLSATIAAETTRRCRSTHWL